MHVVAPGRYAGTLRRLSFLPEGVIAEQQSAPAGSARLASLDPALAEVALRPFLGGGYGSRVVSGPLTNAIIVDDMWLALAIEVGLIGLAVWLWLFVRFLRRTGRAAKLDQSSHGWLLAAFVSSVAAYGIGMLTYDTLSFIQVTFLFVILLALATSVFTGMVAPVVAPGGVPTKLSRRAGSSSGSERAARAPEEGTTTARPRA